MYHRINVTLPSETLKQLDEYAPKGDRSRFIDEAIQHYINQIHQTKAARTIATRVDSQSLNAILLQSHFVNAI